MQQLRYNNSASLLRMEFPPEWKPEDLTALTVEVKNEDAEVLQAADAATLYTATTIDGDVDRFATEFILAAGAGPVAIGDTLRLSSAGGDETVVVRGYTAAARTVRIEGILENQYSDGDSVRGLFATYSLDTTDTDAFTLGMVVTLLWNPTGAGHETRTLAQVSKSRVDLMGIRKRFQRLYPRAYSAFTVPDDRFDDMVFEAEEGVKVDMLLALMDFDRIVDQTVVIQVVMARMAFNWTMNGDDAMIEERDFMDTQYNKVLGKIKNLPIWQDSNQNDKKDKDEVTTHQPRFGRNW